MQVQHAPVSRARPPVAVRRHNRSARAHPRRVLLPALAAVVALAISGVAVGRADPPSSPQRPGPQSGGVISASQRANQVSAVPTAIAAGTAAGTCLAFGPVQGNSRHTVFVDPGHGGVDPGTISSTSTGEAVDEASLSLATGLRLMALLRDGGYRVVMARVDDRLLLRPTAGDLAQGLLTPAGVRHDIAARIACANAAHADILLAIHFNAYDDPAVNGAETLYDPDRPFSAASLRLATLVQQDEVAQLDAAGWSVRDRGVKEDTTAGTPALTAQGAAYGHLLELGPAAPGWLDHPSAMPGMITEPLFLTSWAGADVAASARGQQALAQGMAQSIDAYFAPTSRPGSANGVHK